MFIETLCQLLDALFQFLPSGGVNGCKSHFVVVLFAVLLLSDAKVSRLFHYSSKRRDSGIYEEIWGDCCIKANRCVAFGIRLWSHTEVCSLQTSPSAPCASSFLQSQDNLACKIVRLLTFATVSFGRVALAHSLIVHTLSHCVISSSNLFNPSK